MVQRNFSVYRPFLLLFLFFLPFSVIAEELNATVNSGIISEVQVEQGKFIVDGQTYQFDPKAVSIINSKKEILSLTDLKPGLAVSLTLSADGKMVTAIEIQMDHFMVDDSIIAEKISVSEEN